MVMMIRKAKNNKKREKLKMMIHGTKRNREEAKKAKEVKSLLEIIMKMMQLMKKKLNKNQKLSLQKWQQLTNQI